MQCKDIFNAIATDDLDRVKELISEDNKIVNKINVHGIPILILAIHQNNIAIVRELCINGVDVNSMDFHNRTPLYYASELNYIEIMIELYRWGADDSEPITSESINKKKYCTLCGLHLSLCPTHKNNEDLDSLYIELSNLNLL
jgi:ankyrin repeat protein